MLLTLKEALKHFKVKTNEAIYNRVRRGSLERIVKDGVSYYKIVTNKETNTNKTNPNKSKTVSVSELEELKIKLAKIESELNSKNALIQSKEDLITELKQAKQEQAEHINTLKLTCTLLERENQRLLEKKPPKNKSSNENEAIVIKEKPRPQKEETNTNKANEKNMLDLSKILLDKGLNEKERKRVKARFNKRVGTREITKDKKGKIHISPNEDYSDLLKP